MGVGPSKHRKAIGGLKAAARLHHKAHAKDHEEHTAHKAVVDEKHAKLSKVVAIRKKEWAAQDAGWRALAEKLVAEEEAIKMKEKILISKIIEMLSGKMFSTCFREWKGLTQLLNRQRFREAYRTQVEEHEFDNQELTTQMRAIDQRLAFMSDDGLKSKATALISRLGHRDRTMWFAMWRSFVRESIYNRRDGVSIKAREELEKMTEERDYMLWRLDHSRQNQTADSKAIRDLGQADEERTAALPSLGQGLLLALNRVDETANKFPNYARRTHLDEQQQNLRRACASFAQDGALEPEPEPELQPKEDDERAAEMVGEQEQEDGEEEEEEETSVYGRAMQLSHDFTHGAAGATLQLPALQLPAALPRTALRRHGYMLPRRLPRQLEAMASQGTAALLYGSAGGGPRVDTEALEQAIKDGGPPIEEDTVSGAAVNRVKPQAVPMPPTVVRDGVGGVGGVKAHRQLKPAVR